MYCVLFSLYKQVTKEELAKQHKREKLRLKRKKKKGRRNETEEKENSCDVMFEFVWKTCFLKESWKIDFQLFTRI